MWLEKSREGIYSTVDRKGLMMIMAEIFSITTFHKKLFIKQEIKHFERYLMKL